MEFAEQKAIKLGIKRRSKKQIERRKEKNRECIYLAGILEKNSKRREDDGDEDIDAGSCAAIGHFLFLLPFSFTRMMTTTSMV